MDYDIKYLGTPIRLPGWALLILGAPAPDVIGGIMISDDAKRSMNFDANWGLVLKVGDRAYEENPGGSPYKAGDWVIFEDFHPEARYIHDTLVYFIPDSRVCGALPEPESYEPYVNFVATLPEIEQRAIHKREMLMARMNDAR
jgi:co-chaperonin GroES (HSP10)